MTITLTYPELQDLIRRKLQIDFLFSYSDNKTVCIHPGMNIDVDVSINEIIDGNSICLTYKTNPRFMKPITDFLFNILNKYPEVIEKVAQTYIIHLDKINELQSILSKAYLKEIHFDEYDGMVAEFSLTNKNE